MRLELAVAQFDLSPLVIQRGELVCRGAAVIEQAGDQPEGSTRAVPSAAETVIPGRTSNDAADFA
jgi:hypothetical protein